MRLVLLFGGFTSAGALLAARSLGLKVALHEANSAPGLTNRWLYRLAHRVYLGDGTAAVSFPRVQTRVVGVPVRPDLAGLAATRLDRGPRRPARVLVLGSSTASQFLDARAPELLARLRALGCDVEAWHQVGDGDAGAVQSAYRELAIPARVDGFIDDIAEAYAWGDVAVTRAGAVTLAELAVVGLPSFVVPLARASEDHQVANARAFATAVDWVREADWRTEEVAARLAAILKNRSAWTESAHSIARLARPDAAAALVADCMKLLDRHPEPRP